jgi:four helix bundle protein
MTIQSYRDLRVWQKAMDLSEQSYLMTRKLPKDELFGMISQIRRASVSVPANIAEGYGRDNIGSYIQFLRIAQGSLKELETHFLVCARVGLLLETETTVLLERSEDLGKMLRSLIRSLELKPLKSKTN